MSPWPRMIFSLILNPVSNALTRHQRPRLSASSGPEPGRTADRQLSACGGRGVSEPHAGYFTASLADTDPDVATAIADEAARQNDQIELIASENIVSQAVLEAQGSILTNKTIEGYPGRRYHGWRNERRCHREIGRGSRLPVIWLHLRKRATAFGKSGQPRRLAGAYSTGGDTAQHGSGLGRTSQSRGRPQPFGQMVRRAALRCSTPGRPDRLRRGRTPWRRRTLRS